MESKPEPSAEMVALPVITLRVLVGALLLALLLMLAMLSIEVVILVKVFDLIDLVERLVPAA